MPVRVVHLTASFPRSASDATAPFLLDLVRHQRAAGWDTNVVAVHDAGLPPVQLLEGVPVHRARYGRDDWEVLAYRGGGHARLRSPLHALLLPGLLLSLWWTTFRLVRRVQPDALHAHWILPNALVAALVPGRHRFVLTMHGNDVTLAASRLAGPVARWVARRADVLLAVSEPLARRAEEVLGLAPGTVGMTHLPLPDLEPTPLPDGPPRLIAAGRASREKGFDVLLDALALPEASAWSATLVVDGPERPDLERRAAALGDRVTVLGPLPRAELLALVRDHHAVVAPSRAEGLGFFALEGLASGRPVVASDVGGLPQLVTPGVDGLLVPPGDPAALAAALGRLELRPPAAAAVAAHRPAAVLAEHEAAYKGTSP